MKINEKISLLRKEHGYSQEELASLLGVSRQSVSKWELGDSVPDLDKIIRLSELFQVSTDTLLRDDLDEIKKDASERLDDHQVEEFITTKEKTAPLVTAAVMLCIMSVIPLLVLGTGYEAGYFHALFSSEKAAGPVGLIVLLLMVAPAVGLFLYSNALTGKYEWMESKPVLLSHSAYRQAKELRDESQKQSTILMTAGICTIILGVIPLFLFMFLNPNLVGFGIGIMLGIIAFGVGMIIYASQRNGMWQMLLQEGDYSLEKKKVRHKYSWLCTSYWLTVTAVYLLVSFVFKCWDISWLIFAVAGMLYSVLVNYLERR